MIPPGSHPPPDEILQALQERLSGNPPCIPLDAYLETVLYHPDFGYYTRDKDRVGRSEETDFYTASSLGPVFTKLVLGAIQALLGTTLQRFTFLEIGPEKGEGILTHLPSHPFRESRIIRPGEPVDLPLESIVFSNELFDAQPFRRFVRRGGDWLEAGVTVTGKHLDWILVDPLHALPNLPDSAPEGYTIDWPSGAHALMEQICQQPWKGLFLAFDYGLERATVFSERPHGTGRTYSGHRMGSDLLREPADRDITCHLIWEEMESILSHWQFSGIRLQTQESFFLHHASDSLNRLLAGEPPGFSRVKQTVMELLHPENMGHKFQVLHARRGDF